MKLLNSRFMPTTDDFAALGENAGMEVLLKRVEELVGTLSGTEDSDDVSATDLFYTATLVGTSTNANALAVGPAGTTNPTFKVACSTASAATGLAITGAAAAGGLALSVLSSGTNESVTIDAKGSGTVTINGTATGQVTIGANLGITDAKNVVLATGTGTQIGTAVNQKLGFWAATPVVQQASASQAAITKTTTTTSTTSALTTDLDAVRVLLLAVRTALVNTGMIKGAA